MARFKFLILVAMHILPGVAVAQAVTLHKSPWCGCCGAYVKYLQAHGFDVTAVDHDDMAAVRAEHRVPEHLSSCHTSQIGPYTVEGHVPVAIIEKLLQEQPLSSGIALPAMPAGTPGMPGRQSEPWTVYSLGSADRNPRVYAVY